MYNRAGPSAEFCKDSHLTRRTNLKDEQTEEAQRTGHSLRLLTGLFQRRSGMPAHGTLTRAVTRKPGSCLLWVMKRMLFDNEAKSAFLVKMPEQRGRLPRLSVDMLRRASFWVHG